MVNSSNKHPIKSVPGIDVPVGNENISEQSLEMVSISSVRYNNLIKEIYNKDTLISTLTNKINTLSTSITDRNITIDTLNRRIDSLNTKIRSLLMTIKTNRNVNRNLIRSTTSRINRQKELSKYSSAEIQNRVFVLEWIIRELTKNTQVPVEELLRISEVCKENDPILIRILNPENNNTSEDTQLNQANLTDLHNLPEDTTTDLIEYLDKNGIKSMLDIKLESIYKEE
ncbi:hypothetical protein NEOKW01_0751 [Nematocida sp. AWRm80]|nr:hypothetical protein NEOKW01_0751 [Nematocida sp. AWRm80]